MKAPATNLPKISGNYPRRHPWCHCLIAILFTILRLYSHGDLKAEGKALHYILILVFYLVSLQNPFKCYHASIRYPIPLYPPVFLIRELFILVHLVKEVVLWRGRIELVRIVSKAIWNSSMRIRIFWPWSLRLGYASYLGHCHSGLISARHW